MSDAWTWAPPIEEDFIEDCDCCGQPKRLTEIYFTGEQFLCEKCRWSWVANKVMNAMMPQTSWDDLISQVDDADLYNADYTGE